MVSEKSRSLGAQMQGRAVYLTNDVVAWQILPGRIARFYLSGIYLSPPGWRTTDAVLDWPRGECGVQRKLESG